WLIDTVQERMLTRRSAEWLELLRAVDVPASVVQSLAEVVEDPQVVAREALQPVPGHDGLVTVHSPFRLGLNLPARVEPPPAAGEHTEEVLREAEVEPVVIDRVLTAEGGVATLTKESDV